MSGDSLIDLQHSDSWTHDRDECEDEQVLQPKIKRKRSIRARPRHAVERREEKPSEKPSLRCSDSSQLPSQKDHKYESQFKNDKEHKMLGGLNSYEHNRSDLSLKTRRNLHPRKSSNLVNVPAALKPSRVNCLSYPSEDAIEHSRESCDSKVMNGTGTSSGTKMSDGDVRRVCKISS